MVWQDNPETRDRDQYQLYDNAADDQVIWRLQRDGAAHGGTVRD